MKHDVNGTVEHEGERYTYSSIIWTGDDERRGDEVAAIEPMEGDLDEFIANDELWEKVSDICLADANERILFLDMRNEETLEEGMARLAKVYHPGEAEKVQAVEKSTQPEKGKHTPAPWYEARTGNHQGLIIAEDTGANVAVAYDKKDARLIAAAPELLEALERCADFMGSVAGTEKVSDTFKQAFSDARTVITKATGSE